MKVAKEQEPADHPCQSHLSQTLWHGDPLGDASLLHTLASRLLSLLFPPLAGSLQSGGPLPRKPG